MSLRRARQTGFFWAIVAACGSILSGLFAGKLTLVFGALLTGYVLCVTLHAYRIQSALDRRRAQQRALRQSLDQLCAGSAYDGEALQISEALRERARDGRPLC
ncbi:MAG TPA: hypothetical protein VJN18_11140 [Polyangiaceae bacterium]|nr:hypothetical protein [Polyangiaceae bacterium]